MIFPKKPGQALTDLNIREALRNAGHSLPAIDNYFKQRGESLFQFGVFKLASGRESNIKIECDAFTDQDWRTLAYIIHRLIGPFSSVEGVPTGGLKLAKALEVYKFSNPVHPHLIVDDVWTTGGSMNRTLKAWLEKDENNKYRTVIGAVVFARGKLDNWVKAIFPWPEAIHNL